MPKNGAVHLVDHPLIRHKLGWMREKSTGHQLFRELLDEVATLMTYEVTRELPLQPRSVQTPLQRMSGQELAGRKMAVVAILRAGLGMLPGILRVVPKARVGHIGLFRDPQTLRPVEYYQKLPANLSDRFVLLADPMLATGFSAVRAAHILMECGAKKIALMSLIAAPEGVRTMQEQHPRIPIYVAAIDKKLNSHGYILPGLGDAGDRLFGTV